MARPRKFTKNSALDVEVPLKLRLSQSEMNRLNRKTRFGVRNSVQSIAKYALEPAMERAARLSGLFIGRPETKFSTAAGTFVDALYGNDVKVRTGRRTHYIVGKGKNRRSRRILSYRAGMKSPKAYRARGRADKIGDVTLLLSVDTRKNYYNWLANLWEHGWTNKLHRWKHSGNQFMTLAVRAELPKIRDRFARGVRAALEARGDRIRSSDLRKLG